MKTTTFILAGLTGCLVVLASAVPAQAERPGAPKLLPDSTVLYLRVADMRELVEKFQQTSMGRIANDEQIRPLIRDLYDSAGEAYKQIEERIGIPLDQLLAIPQGELCVALVIPPQGRPALVALADVGDKLAAAEKLLARAEEELLARGGTRSSEMVGETDLAIYTTPGSGDRQLVQFVRENVILFVSDVALAKEILSVWDGDEEAMTLSENRKFTTIMAQSAGTKDERPQISWYADPIEFARRAGRGNLSAQAGLALLSPLGLDGFQAVGGSMIFATEEFDSISHMHVMLSNPREGLLNVLALESGDTTPEVWVPDDVASYMTMNWDLEQSYREINAFVEILRGEEDALRNALQQRIGDRLGIDVQKDLIEAVERRFTMLTWMEKPARINSQTTLLAVKLNDAARFKGVLDRILTNFSTRFTKKTYGTASYYQMAVPERGNFDAEMTRRPEVCIGILDDYLIFTDSAQLYQRVVMTKSDPTRSLANELDFKLIASKIDRQVGPNKAGMIAFSRPEEAMRSMYELAVRDATRQRLATQAENNALFRALNDALQRHPLPPFPVIARYLAPAGGMMTLDETGLHYTSFSLRRE